MMTRRTARRPCAGSWRRGITEQFVLHPVYNIDKGKHRKGSDLMEYKVKQLLNSKLVPAVLSMILGIVIVIARRSAVDLLVKIVGGIVIAAAIGFILVYLTRPDKDAGNLTMVLVSAGAAALIGILIITFAESIVNIFPILMGVYLILNGLSHLTAGYADPENRTVAVILGVLVIALGLLIVVQPSFLVNTIMIFIGAAFIVNGVFDLLMEKKFTGSLR